jgi:hypothetical protein
MKINLNLSITEIVAWWGAIIATSLLLWDIYKWKTSGPKVGITVSSNIITVGDPIREGKTYISVKAVNTGTRQTTISNLCMQHYSTCWSLFRKKPDESMVITNPGISRPIPHVLQPGTIWNGLIHQDDSVVEMATQGYLICELFISNKKKPITRRIVITPKKKGSGPNKPPQK